MVVGFLGAQKELGQSLSPGCRAGAGVGGIGLLEGFFFLSLNGKNVFHVMYSDHTFPFSPQEILFAK